MWRRRIIFFATCLLLTVGVEFGVSGERPAVEDRETVYGLLDHSGRPQEITVVDWLRIYGPGTRRVLDPGDLTAVENVKGPERPTKVREGLLWQVECRGEYKDLFYRGRTEKPLPFAVHIDYFLNGRAVPAEKVPGAKGELLVRIGLRNGLRTRTRLVYKNARGETVDRIEELVVPLAVNVTTDLPASRFSRFEAPGATSTAVGATVKLSWVVFPYPTAEITLRLHSEAGMALGPFYFTVFPMIPPVTVPAATGQLRTIYDGLKRMDDGLFQLNNYLGEFSRGGESFRGGIGILEAGVADLARLNEAHQEIVRRCLVGLEGTDLGAFTTAFGRLDELVQGLATLAEGLDGLSRLNQAHRTVLNGIREELAGFDLEPLAQGAGALGDLGQTLAATDEYLGRAATSVSIQAKRASAAKARQEEVTALLVRLAKTYPEITGASEYKELQNLLAAQEKDLAALTAGGREKGQSFDGLGFTGRLLATMVERVKKGREGLQTLSLYGSRAEEMAAGFNRLKTALDVLAEGGELAGQHLPGLKDAATGLAQAKAGVDLMRQGLHGAMAGNRGLGDTLREALTGLKGALQVLLTGGKIDGQEVPGLVTAREGLARLAEGLWQLRQGTEKAYTGVGQIQEGVARLREEGSQKFIAGLEPALTDLARAEALQQALKAAVAAYDHFVGKPAGAKGEVRFLLRTEALE